MFCVDNLNFLFFNIRLLREAFHRFFFPCAHSCKKKDIWAVYCNFICAIFLFCFFPQFSVLPSALHYQHYHENVKIGKKSFKTETEQWFLNVFIHIWHPFSIWTFCSKIWQFWPWKCQLSQFRVPRNILKMTFHKKNSKKWWKNSIKTALQRHVFQNYFTLVPRV